MKKIFTLVLVLGLLIFAAMAVAKSASAVMAKRPTILLLALVWTRRSPKMNAAGHDFCGHKEDALRDAKAAREQLHLAEDCAKCK